MMTRTRLRHRRLPAGAVAAAAALALAGALVTGPAGAQQGNAPASTTGAGQSSVGDTGHGNSLPMPANPAAQTGRTPMQNQSNPGAAGAGGGDQSATSGTTARKQLPPEPGQSANQQGTGRSVDVQTGGGSGQQQMLQPQQPQAGQDTGGQQPAGQRAAAPSVELQSSGTKAQQPVTRQSLEPQPRTGNGPSGLEKGEPGGETKVTPGGGDGGTSSAGGIPVAPQSSGTR